VSEVVSYGLGLDQGVASIGWAVLALDASGKPIGVERLGAHLFEVGVGTGVGEFAAGKKDTSHAIPRRLARQARKQYRARVLRKKRLLRWLQELGLMPGGDISSAEGRDALLKSLDDQLRKKWETGAADHRTRQLLPYRLRAAGLTGKLEPFELGRALYHLAQRRGYLSNRKAQSASKDPCDAKKDKSSAKLKADEAQAKEDPGVVRDAIVELQRQMEGAGCKTLAEYFSTLDPAGTFNDRIRGRWTAREMFLEEFNRIWDEQSKHHPKLNEKAKPRLHREIKHPTPKELHRRSERDGPNPIPRGTMESRPYRDEVYDAIFTQRPLQSMSHLIGRCDLVPDKKRCPLGHRMAQRFRLLQGVNNLAIQLPDHSRHPLSREQRDSLIDILQRDGGITFPKLRKMFGLPKGARFNLEEGGEERLMGNRTEAKCRCIFGDERWDAMSDTEKDGVVQDLLLFAKPSALAKRGLRVWKLSKDQADALGDCVLENGYAAHSKEALAMLLPTMEDGTPYSTALKEAKRAAGHDIDDDGVFDLLPPVEDKKHGLGPLRNPTVTRALTELRKLVNAIVRKYGKPKWIRIELARDLKRARVHRERISAEMRAQEKRRDAARGYVLQKAGIANASRADIERVLLAEECGWICPYTGKQFGMADVVGRHPRVDVEHIRPFSRSLDDSYLNKTLCFVHENRNIKKSQTPFETYSRSPERWEEMLDRVRRFKGDAARIKLERFMEKEIPEGFAQRHLAETRKIGAASAEYLGLLYGGEIDANHNRRVFVTTGGLTAHLRREWHLNGVLSDDGEKTREDHRHHAVDALVVALTDTRAVQALQTAAERASEAGRRLFAPVEAPWKDFLDSVREKVGQINVSHRQSRRVAGKLHAETNYSRPTGPTGERRIRKELAKLSEKEVERIIDPKVRAAVEARIKELSLKPKGPARQYTDFADPKTHPFTITKAGARNPIHKVRLKSSEKPWAVGKGPRERFVTSTAGSNHHAVLSKLPDGKWTDRPVAIIDVRAESTQARPHGGTSMTLAAGEFVLLKDEAGRESLYRVLSVSDGDIELIAHNDARLSTERKKDRTRGGANALMKRGLRKVTVTYLGEIRRAGG